MIFLGIDNPVDAERWLVDTTDLLKVARVPNENQVEVAKIQLKDMARTWWLAEEARLKKSITWDQFLKDLWEILPRNSLKGDGRTIYQIAAEEPDRRRIYGRVFET